MASGKAITGFAIRSRKASISQSPYATTQRSDPRECAQKHAGARGFLRARPRRSRGNFAASGRLPLAVMYPEIGPRYRDAPLEPAPALESITVPDYLRQEKSEKLEMII